MARVILSSGSSWNEHAIFETACDRGNETPWEEMVSAKDCPVGVEQACHPSWSVAGTSSAIMINSSLRARGTPWRSQVLDCAAETAARIRVEAGSRLEAALTAREEADFRSNVVFTASAMQGARCFKSCPVPTRAVAAVSRPRLRSVGTAANPMKIIA